MNLDRNRFEAQKEATDPSRISRQISERQISSVIDNLKKNFDSYLQDSIKIFFNGGPELRPHRYCPKCFENRGEVYRFPPQQLRLLFIWLLATIVDWCLLAVGLVARLGHRPSAQC